jgi:hypothetical protein
MKADRAGQSPLLLLDVANILERENVSYAVVGAMAAAFHGFVRASVDADAVLFLDRPYSFEWTVALRKAGWRVNRRQGGEDDPIPWVVAVSDKYGNRVDLLIGLRGIDAGTRARTVTGTLGGATIRFVGAEDLLAMKLFAGGPRDVEDVRGILRAECVPLDKTLLKKLVERYGRKELRLLNSLLEEIK